MALTSILNTAYLSAGMSFPEIGSKLNLCFTFKRRMSFCNIFLKKDECNNLKDKSYTVNSFGSLQTVAASRVYKIIY